MKKTVSVIVSGKVQGVFYRQSTKEKARALGLTGTVRNNKDGSVEIIATGDADSIAALIAWCHEGPREARVTDVAVQDIPVTQFESFHVIK